MVRAGVADGRGDRLDEPGAGGERAGAEDRDGAVADNPPVAGAVVGVEGAHGEGFGHSHSLGARGHQLAGPGELGDVIILQQRVFLRLVAGAAERAKGVTVDQAVITRVVPQ
jgi:hypothetical protein